jgi:hypothetical protein
MCKSVVVILIDQRSKSAVKVQEILTKYGCYIKTRLGIHDVLPDECSDEGLVILHMCCSEEVLSQLEDDLNSIDKVKAKSVTLSFED